MSIRAAIAIALSLVALTASCSSETDGSAAAVDSPAPATTTTSNPSASAVASKSDVPLSVSWIPRLESLALTSCSGAGAFTANCLGDSLALKNATLELIRDADLRGESILEGKAAQVVADLDRWSGECSTTTARSPERARCLSVIMLLPTRHEALMAAIHESEAK